MRSERETRPDRDAYGEAGRNRRAMAASTGRTRKPMPPTAPFARIARVLPAVLFAGGCASSPLPRHLPTSSPASLEAEPVRAAVVRLALDEDPPLPGEASGGWSGLDVEAARPEASARLLSLDEAVRLALENNRELRARLEALGIPEGRVRQAGLVPNPTVEAELLPERNTTLEMAVEYDLTSLVLAPLRARAERAELEAERLEVAAALVTLGYETRVGYSVLQAAEARLGVARRALEAQAAARDAADALHAAGNLPDLDHAALTASYERERLVVAGFELEASQAKERLRRLLGLHGAAAELEVEPMSQATSAELELPDALERRALEASLELAALRRRLEAAARRAGVARTEGWLPDLSVDLHILRGQPDEPVGTPSDPALRFGGGLTVSIPLFDRQQGRVQAFEAEGRALLERYFGLAVDVRSSAREAENRLASAHARVRHLETVVRPAQDRVLAQTLLQYDAMQLDVFRLLAARRARLEVELAYVDTVNELFVARAAVEALLAGQRVEAPTRAVSPSPGAGAASEGGH